MGWFENNKPFGFGLRLYSEGGKDVGLWEQDVLVQMAIIYNNGMQHRMELLFGHNVNAFKDRGQSTFIHQLKYLFLMT